MSDLLSWAIPFYGPTQLALQGGESAYRLLGGAPSMDASGQSISAQNRLGDQQNTARPFARIPDIFGRVRAVFDLLSAPYRVFSNNVETEHSYLCLGRGQYLIEDLREGTTPVIKDDGSPNISGLSVEVWGPGTSPNSGSPQLRVGAAITAPFVAAKRCKGIDGPTIPSPTLRIVGDDSIAFFKPNIIRASETSEISFPEVFAPGDSLVLTYASLSGTYHILTVDDQEMTLADPETIRADWAALDPPPGGPSAYLSGKPILEGTKNRWVGPFFLDSPDATSVNLNIVAPQGLYKIGGDDHLQSAVQQVIEVEITPCDASGTASGSPGTTEFPVVGSASDRAERGFTFTVLHAGRCLARMRRVTATDYGWSGQYLDEIKWRDAYQMTPITASAFGDVTTVRVAVRATRQATGLKERKLNALATRMVTRRGAYPLVASRRVDDIITHVALDPFIGRRSNGEVDIADIYATIAAAEAYFGSALAVEWNGTLDQDSQSAEEAIALIAQAASCTAYREGNVLRLSLERQTDDSILLLNHRNKVPGTEQRTFYFGSASENDGVEFEYDDPTTGTREVLYLPADRSAVNPQRLQSVGIRNRLQAYLLGARAWHKMRLPSEVVEVQALHAVDVVPPNGRILIADGTSPETMDGDVKGATDAAYLDAALPVVLDGGTRLTLSQPARFQAGKTYTAFLQLSDGTTQGIGVTEGASDREVVLDTAPRLSLLTDPSAVSAIGITKFLILADDDASARAFLLTERESVDRLTRTVRATSYNAGHYANDLDYVNGIVDGNGYPI